MLLHHIHFRARKDGKESVFGMYHFVVHYCPSGIWNVVPATRGTVYQSSRNIHPMLGLPKSAIERFKTEWGHLLETAVGAYLINRSAEEGFEVFWWREGNYEVDFVLQKGTRITAIEVKSGRIKNVEGMSRFLSKFPNSLRIIIGSPENSLDDFLTGLIPLFD